MITIYLALFIIYDIEPHAKETFFKRLFFSFKKPPGILSAGGTHIINP